MNGKWKIGISLAGILSLLAVAFYSGATYSSLNHHLKRSDFHETRKQKEELIDGRIRLHLKPLEVQLDEMNKKLDLLVNGK